MRVKAFCFRQVGDGPMQKGGVTSIMQLRARLRLPACSSVRPFALALVLLSLTSWLDCDTVAPVLGPAVEVQVTPAGVSVSGTGSTTTFGVVALNAIGDTITSLAITRSSLNPHIATIDEHGTATAVASGQVTIAAEVEGLVGYGLLTVSTLDVGPVTSRSTEFVPAVPLLDVSRTSSSDVFAVGVDGFVLHYDWTAWNPTPSGTAENLSSVRGLSSSDIYAAGNSGTSLHYVGTSWSAKTSGTNVRLSSVSGTSSGDVYAVGEWGMILRGAR